MWSNKMAQLAEIAYLDSKEAKAHKKKLGYTGHKFFEDDGAQCHAFWNKTEYVLAFRGTEPSELSDLLADLNAIPRGAMTHGLVHSGFRNECDKLWSVIAKHQLTHENKTLHITGHSLGAAMATVCASRMEEYTAVESLTTFGSPRVGTRKFVKAISTPHKRFVNNNDLVTKVPLFIMGYKHHGDQQYINFYGNIRKLTTWQMIKDKWRGWRSGILDGAEDHGMQNYVKHTEKLND
jgi:triacylglycerol lipase|tara:strand:- start:1784 stop:2491 length:708 start_codon:yes stop_codon:yes gene_type:complete